MKTVEAALISDCGRYKVEIERRSGGGFQVTSYKWTEEWLEDHKVGEYWADVSSTVTLTDTLEKAHELAHEKLLFLSSSQDAAQ